MKSSLVMLAAGALLAIPISAAAAADPRVDPQTVPVGVDARLLGTHVDGPVVATGRLVDRGGRSARGHVALLAWPNERVNRTLESGSRFATPTVGWANTGTNGLFEVRLDRSRLGAAHVGRDGRVNLLAVGWTGRAEATWFFGTTIDAAGASAAGRRAQAPTLTLTADQPLTSRNALKARRVAIRAGISPLLGVPCRWVILSTHDVMVVVGEGWPYGADRSWMKSVSTHSETLGAAVSQTGAFGSWSPNGTTVSSAGVTFTWAESTEFRDYRDQHRYARIREWCGGVFIGNFYEKDQYPTGGFGNGAIYPYPRWTNCAPVTAGLWERSASNGNHYRLSVGVKIAGVLGIDLSSDSNYDSSHILYLRLTANGKVCGNDTVPSLASKVESGR